MPSWTIKSLLTWCAEDFKKRGASSARLDAELLVAHALGVERVRLYIDFDRPLDADELAAVRALVARRRRNEPVAYILGRRAFYGRDFAVRPGVLIPRPDTETLVDRALELIPTGSADEEGAPGNVAGDVASLDRVLDVGAGSGAIGLTLAAERPALRVELVDISDEALAVTRANAESLGVSERVVTTRSDLLDAVPREPRFGLIVSNPPYIPSSDLADLMPDVRDHEPAEALDGGADGLDVYRRLIPQALDRLHPGGTLLLEVGKGQADDVRALGRAAGAVDVGVHRDLGGIARVVELQRAP